MARDIDWRVKHEQHRRVRRRGWEVFSNADGPSVLRNAIPNALEVLLAALLAAVGTAAWLMWA